MNRFIFPMLALASVLTGCTSSAEVATTTTAPSTTTTAPAALTASDIVARFKTAGLPVGATVDYTADTDPNNQLGRPHGYTSKTNWIDTRLPAPTDNEFYPSDGGAVQVYATAEDAQAAADHNTRVAQAIQSSGYNFVRGTTLIRVSGQLPPDQANAYDAVARTALGL